MGHAPSSPSPLSSNDPVRWENTVKLYEAVEQRNQLALVQLRECKLDTEWRQTQLKTLLDWLDVQRKDPRVREQIQSDFALVFSWISLAENGVSNWIYSPFAVASDVDRTPMSLLFELYVNPRHWISQMLVDKSDVSPFMGHKSAVGTESQFVQTCYRCFWTGAGIECKSEYFHLESIFPIEGLFDPRNQVLVCFAAPRTASSGFQYTDTPQSVEVKSCFRDPAAVFKTASDSLRWMGHYPLNACPLIYTDMSGELHHTSVNAQGTLLCPRSSIRQQIASVWMYLVHKYPAARTSLECILPWELALKWLKQPITLRQIFMDIYSQRLLGDLNPFCYMPDPARRVEAAIRLIKPPSAAIQLEMELPELEDDAANKKAADQICVLGHTTVFKYHVAMKAGQFHVYSDSPEARKDPLMRALNAYSSKFNPVE